MSAEQTQQGSAEPPTGDVQTVLEPVRLALSKVDEAQRYRLLASLLTALADVSGAGGNGRGASPEQVESLNKRILLLGEEKATLADELAMTRADLTRRTSQAEAEQARADELQRLVDEQRKRLEGVKAESSELEAQIVSKNNELHRLEVETEQLTLKLQRAESDATGQQQIDGLEERNRQLTTELDRVRQELDDLRDAKDAEIERVKGDVQEAQATASAGADELLLELWGRMAQNKPGLVPGGAQPTSQAAERLIDGFIEMVRFVDDLDKSMRVFLGKYTKHHPSVKVPWDVYTKRDDVRKVAEQVVAPQTGKPAALLKMRLRVLYSWLEAAMIGCDSALESIAPELQQHMRGPAGTESDPKCKILDYLRNDGHELFSQHIRELRSQKLAETYGRSG